MKDDNPDKGTETVEGNTSDGSEVLKDDNPDKGTETLEAMSFGLIERVER